MNIKNHLQKIARTSAVLIPATMLLCLSTSAQSDSPVSYEYRDLDGDSQTVEAVYDAINNITWLADTNLGLTQTFGIERYDPNTDFDYWALQISANGTMTEATAMHYMDLMNASNYLGFSQWRLPEYSGWPDAGCNEQFNDGAVAFGNGCTGGEMSSFNRDVFSYGVGVEEVLKNMDDITRWIGGATGPSGGMFYYRFREDRLRFCAGGFCTTSVVWPVHDGDIGTPVNLECEYTNDSVWGWNGYDSCRSSVVAASEGQCIDTGNSNDGWGWNGVESCQLPTTGEGICRGYGHYPWGWNDTTQTSCRLDDGRPVVAEECVDTLPLNDGWGWNGVESCQLAATGDGVCMDYGDYPWGWNNTTKTSCRLDAS